MSIILNNGTPIFVQVKEWLENEILAERLIEGDKAPSQNELAQLFNINPMTALKGISILESRGVLIKKRGIGMFVASQSKQIIYDLRRHETLNEIIDDLVTEAIRLQVDKENIFNMINQRFDKAEGDEND